MFKRDYRHSEAGRHTSKKLKRSAIWLGGIVGAVLGVSVFAFWFDYSNNVGILKLEWDGGQREEDLRHWKTVQGVILSVSEDDGHSSLRFEYRAGLVSYSAVTEFDGTSPYAPGMGVTVRHDPMMPQLAVVEPGRLALPVDTSLAGIFYRPDVRGTVTSYYQPDSDGYSMVRFEYSVHGVSYTGEQRLHLEWASSDPPYSPGSEVRVTYEPVEPSVAVIEFVRQSPGEDGQLTVVVLTFLLAMGLAAAAMIIMIVIAVRAVTYVWRVHRWSPTRQTGL